MKAITLQQPFATLLVLGAKCIETRSWSTAHRGPLAVHASSTFPPKARALCRREPFRRRLAQAGITDWSELPLGALLGTVRLLECRRVEEIDLDGLSEEELCFGDYAAGRWAWFVDSAASLPGPIPWKGQLGVFDIADVLLAPA
jgi:hypothetical protein